MSAVYGDMLSFFPELFRMFDYFKMTPSPVASYTSREDLGKVRGVFQYMKKGELHREEESLSDVSVPTIWTRKKLSVGDYFISFDDETFRIINSASWLFEGGFYCYVLETVVGNTDEQTEHEYVNLGQDSYD